MKSTILKEIYSEWLSTADPRDATFVDEVYALCEANYGKGGDVVVECYAPADILQEFSDLNDVIETCKIRVEQECNARWGEDDDPELDRYHASREWDVEGDQDEL